ncbi:MAG: 1-deoxy-D-xylulose-5-phosphate reductoisomerase, partial [Dehalococcoidales bacterium]|nr:1-deoxy-D-xylulose-5-phosphate reductoisomerase [Dehalococcoidales bacterium]
TVVIATSRTVAIRATVAAARSGKTIALANKESLVAAGEIVMREARRSGARILPVDSEHSAIFQCLKGERKPPHRIILTASGGPFLKLGKTEIQNATAAQALRHPSWRMGKKVTVDAASLMNKGLEVIEAHWLFNMPFDRITVLVHPQSIVHSMVEFADGSVKAQMGYPDMRLPIQYALTYPERLKNENLPRLDWVSLKSLTFDLPDTERFPCLELAVRAGKAGGTMPSVLAAADDVAVELFLAQRIRFGDIPDVLGRVLAAHRNIFRPSLEDILEAMRWAREKTFELAGGTQ